MIKNNLSIFNKDSFSLKEFSKLFLISDFNYISKCYLYFSSNNEKYINFLKYTRNNKGTLLYYNNKEINLREILQTFDRDFLKLVIRIKIHQSDYEINISWDDFEKHTSLSKDQFYNFYKDYLININK